MGLGGLGALAAVGALVVPSAQQILLALAGIGLFGGVLTLYLTPERFIAADTGRDVYAALASNEAAIVAELGLTDHRVYVPTPDADHPVRLFIPHIEEYTLPEADTLSNTIIAPAEPERRGVAFEPSGGRLFESFRRALSGPLGETPATLGTQLTDALIAQFELVETAEAAVDATGEGLTVTVSEAAYGPPTRFDHPVASFVAVGLAQGLARPVTVSVSAADDDRYDYRLRCRWERDDE
jgi:hypothetical protein